MLRIEFRASPNGVLEDLYSGLDPETLEVNSVLQIDETEWMGFLTAIGGEAEPAPAIERLDTVELLYDQSLGTDSNTSNVLAIITDTGAFLPQTLAQLHAVPHSIHLNDRAIESTATVSDWDHLRSVANRVETTHETFELLSVTQIDQVGSLLGNDRFKQATRGVLTNDQFEALETAYRMGYFVVPRETSASDIAAHLGVSQSTFSERLRRALDSLLAVAFGQESRSSQGT